MSMTVARRRTAILPGAAAAAQTLPENAADVLAVHVGGSAVGVVSASLCVANAATSPAVPHAPSASLDLTGAAVADEIVEAEYVGVGDISRWQ